MKQINHCLICENSYKDFEKGAMCGLTKQKPNFGSHCEKITFSNSLFKRIETLNLDDKLISQKKNLVFGNVIFFLLVSVAFMVAGYILWQLIYSKGYYVILPILISLIGLVIIPLASAPLKKYLHDKKSIRKKLKTLNEVLSEYGLEYQVEIETKKGSHNILDVNTNIKLIKNGKLSKIYSNSFNYNNNEKKVDNYYFGKTISKENRPDPLKGLSSETWPL